MLETNKKQYMKLALWSLIVGSLFVWGLTNVPDIMGYMSVGLILILFFRLFKK